MKSKEASVTIIVAFIGLCGVLGAAIISNWDKMLPATPTYVAPNPNPYDPTKELDTPIPPIETNIPVLPCTITLTTPLAGSILDNGRYDGKDRIIWDFHWSDCPRATEYQLYAIGNLAQNPRIDVTVSDSSYHSEEGGYIANKNLYGWTWRVRAKVNGEWGLWSETRVFDVEPLDSDSPSP
jgi:hypothetical protein